MNYNNDISTIIDAYLKGKLEGAELHDFEQKLVQDQALAKEVNKARILNHVVMQHRLLDIKALTNTQQAKLERKRKTIKKGLILSGIVLTGILVGIFYSPEEEKLTPVPSNVVNNTPDVVMEKETTTETKPVTPSAKEATLKEVISKTNISSEDAIVSSKVVEEALELPESNTESKEVKFLMEKQVQKEEASPAIEVAAPCTAEGIKATILTTPSCAGKQEGKIVVSEIIGGHAPYSTKLYKATGEELQRMQQISSGEYELVVTDDNGCIEVFPATIKEDNCSINAYFNPSLGEKWAVPVSEKEGTLTVFTKTGVPLHSQKIDANEQVYWNGVSKSTLTSPGYYIFTIEYTDGSVLKGSITISQ